MPTMDEISAVKKILAEYFEDEPASLAILAKDVLAAAEKIRLHNDLILHRMRTHDRKPQAKREKAWGNDYWAAKPKRRKHPVFTRNE